MPRKKKVGSWGDNPDKFSDPSLGSGISSYGMSSSSGSKDSDNPLAWSDVARKNIAMSRSDQDAIFQHVQEMFKDQIEPDIVHIILDENDWKVDETVDKLTMMSSDFERQRSQFGTMQDSRLNRPYSRPEDIPGSNQSRLPARRSRTSESGGSLTMLSPKTPSQIGGMNYPEMFASINSGQPSVQSMGAFDSYGMGYSSNYNDTTRMGYDNVRSVPQHGYTMTENYQQNLMPSIVSTSSKTMPYSSSALYTGSLNPYQSSGAHGKKSTMQTDSSVHTVSHSGDRKEHSYSSNGEGKSSSSDSGSKNKHANTHQEQKNRAQKRGRKTTMSLNPEEREALENLIEDVIVGIGEGVIDSEESTSSENESEEEVKTPTDTSGKEERLRSLGTDEEACETHVKQERMFLKDNHKHKQVPKEAVKKDGGKTNEQGQKVYPPQLKVAVKHMKNLPPRFLRKIQTNKDDDQGKFSEKPHRIQEVPEPPPEPPKHVEILTKPKIEPMPLTARERDFRPGKSKEEQKMEKKKKVRGMLDTLDHYFEQSTPAEEKKVVENKLDEGNMVIIAPVNENPYLGDKLTHSAPASTQVSPNTQPLESKQKIDIGHLDPAIKAQGPAMLSLHHLISQAPPSISSIAGQTMNRSPQMGVPDSPGISCKELESKMLLSSESSNEPKHSIQNVPFSGMSQPPAVSLGGIFTGVTQPGHVTTVPAQFNHSPPMKQHVSLSNQQVYTNNQFNQQAMHQQAPQNSAMNQPPIANQMNQYGHFVQLSQPVRMPFGMQLPHQHKSTFSVDAPEFVPRSFTPNIAGHAISRASNQALNQQLYTSPPVYATNVKSQAMPIVASSQQMVVPTGMVTSINTHMGGIPVQPLQAPPHGPVQIPEGFTAPPPPLPQSIPVSMGVGRASPQVSNTVATLTQTQDQLATNLGRSSPIPAPVQPAFMIPKVPQTVGAHPGMAPPGGVGMVYAPMYQHYAPGIHPAAAAAAAAAQYPIHAGPFLVQAWSGGRKDKYNHTHPLHHSHPATQSKLSGTATKPRHAGHYLKSTTSPKVPHRSQNEMSPQQAKEKVQNLINQNKKTMLILRGLPGSGKSAIAQECKFDGVILSTDEFFMKNGLYDFDSSKLSEAHEWNQKKAKEAVETGTNPVIIDNTHTQAWEMRPYVSLALKNDYHIEIVEPNTAWKFKVKELAQKNTHDVPAEKIAQMADRYESHVTIERVMGGVDKKKDDTSQGQEADGEGEEKKPKKRRRRRRRRRKKPVEEDNASDSEKEDRSSDEDMAEKPHKTPQPVVSTDTTENEMEKTSSKTSTKMSLVNTKKMSSSSVDSEEIITFTPQHDFPKAVVQEDAKGASAVMEECNASKDWNEDVALEKVKENVTDSSYPAVTATIEPVENVVKENSPQNLVVTVKTVQEKSNAPKTVELIDSVSDKKVCEQLNENGEDVETVSEEDFQEMIVEDGSPIASDTKGLVITDEISISDMIKELKVNEDSAVQDLALDCFTAVQSDSDGISVSPTNNDTVNRELKVISQNRLNELDSEDQIVDKVKTALRVEIEKFVKEQIVDSLLNEELPKMTESLIGENGVTTAHVHIMDQSSADTEPLEGASTDSSESPPEKDESVEREVSGSSLTGSESQSSSEIHPQVRPLETEKEAVDLHETGSNCLSAESGKESAYWAGDDAVPDRYSIAVGSLEQQTKTQFILSEDKVKGVGVYNGKACGDNADVNPHVVAGEPKQQRERRNREKASVKWELESTSNEPNEWSTAEEDDLERQEVALQTDKMVGKIGEIRPVDVKEATDNLNVLSDVQCSNNSKNSSDLIDEKQFQGNVPNNEEMLKTGSLEEHISETVATGDGGVVNKNWRAALPKFVNGIQAAESLNLQDSCNDKCVTDVHTFTSSADLASAEKLLRSVSQDPKSLVDFRVLNAVPREINSGLMNYSASSSSPSRGPLLRDSACMTEPIETSEASQALACLKQYFPDADEEYLTHILGQCDGDTDAAANLLLDAGCEMKLDDAKPIGKSDTVRTEQLGDFHETEENFQKVNNVSTVVPQTEVQAHTPLPEDVRPKNKGMILKTGSDVTGAITSPASLVSLCYDSMSSGFAQSSFLCSEIVNNDVKRMCSIEEFTHKPSLENVSADTSDLNLSGRCRGSLDEMTDVFGLSMPPDAELENIMALNRQLGDSANPFLYVNGDIALEDDLDDSAKVKESPRSVMSGDNDDLDADDNVDAMLTLTPEMAQQLIDLFGPVGFSISPDSMYADDLRVRLSRKCAKQIHHRWSLTLKQKFAFEEAAIDKMIRDDENYARMLQAEEDNKVHSVLQNDQPPVSSPSRKPVRLDTSRERTREKAPPCESLVNIMNDQYEEQAIVESRRDFESRSASSPERHLSTRLKKQELYQLYPLMDQPILDDIFEGTGFMLGKTKAKIEELYGKREPVRNVMTEEAREKMERDAFNKALVASLQEEWLGEDSHDGAEGGYQQLQGTDYDNLRHEASMYYKLRHESFQKAQEAYRRGLRPLASWYSQVGHVHSRKLKEANHRAAELLMKERNAEQGPRTIDLHGLHVNEALLIFKREIEQREKERRERPEMRMALKQLSVVTGWGRHSQGGQAKLRPKIIQWLQQHGYRFTEATIGKLDISLK